MIVVDVTKRSVLAVSVVSAQWHAESVSEVCTAEADLARQKLTLTCRYSHSSAVLASDPAPLGG